LAERIRYRLALDLDVRTDDLIREYYKCFNERRVAAATALFSPDAVLEMAPFAPPGGRGAYAEFVETWVHAFPDAVFAIEHVEQRNDTMCEVDLMATGTHTGLLTLGEFGQVPPSGLRPHVRLRELLEIRDGAIRYANLSCDIHQLVRELTHVNYQLLLERTAEVTALAEELARADGDPATQRDLGERVARALDAARRVARPNFNRR
jgi:predicted ester cyclase